MRRSAADAAETRRRVLDSALLTFAEHGYDSATFERIAARIGLTRGAVHHHFRGGKDELLAAVLTEQWERYGDRVLAPLHDPSTAPATALADFLTGYLRLLGDDPLFRALATVSTLVAAQAGISETNLAEWQHSINEWRTALATVLDRAGPLRPDITTDAAVFTLVTIVTGATDIAALAPHHLPADDRARGAVATTAVRGLFPEEQT